MIIYALDPQLSVFFSTHNVGVKELQRTFKVYPFWVLGVWLIEGRKTRYR